jgi:hypothetical protein
MGRCTGWHDVCRAGRDVQVPLRTNGHLGQLFRAATKTLAKERDAERGREHRHGSGRFRHRGRIRHQAHVVKRKACKLDPEKAILKWVEFVLAVKFPNISSVYAKPLETAVKKTMVAIPGSKKGRGPTCKARSLCQPEIQAI